MALIISSEDAYVLPGTRAISSACKKKRGCVWPHGPLLCKAKHLSSKPNEKPAGALVCIYPWRIKFPLGGQRYTRATGLLDFYSLTRAARFFYSATARGEEQRRRRRPRLSAADDYTCLFNTKGSKTNTVIRRQPRAL